VSKQFDGSIREIRSVQRKDKTMKKMVLICLMILGLTAGCASTGSEKNDDMKVNPGEIMEHHEEGM